MVNSNYVPEKGDLVWLNSVVDNINWSNVEFLHIVVAETSSQREPVHQNGSTASRWLSVLMDGTPLPLVSAIAL